MGKGQPIKLFGELATVGQTRTGAAKWGLQVSITNDLTLYPDDDAIAEVAANAIKQTFGNLEKGLKLDGSPLPEASPATLERRKYLREQAKRNGKRHPRYLENTPRRKALAKKTRRVWARQVKTGKLGTFLPTESTKQGFNTGMLAKSASVAHEKSGVFAVFVADNRGVIRIHGKTAIERAWPIISGDPARWAEQPNVRQALAAIPGMLLRKRAGAAVSSLVDLVESVSELADEVSEASEASEE